MCGTRLALCFCDVTYNQNKSYATSFFFFGNKERLTFLFKTNMPFLLFVLRDVHFFLLGGLRQKKLSYAFSKKRKLRFCGLHQAKKNPPLL